MLGPMAGVIGSLAALEVFRAIAPFGDDSAGNLLLDVLSLRFRTLRLPKDPAAPPAPVFDRRRRGITAVWSR